MKRVLAVLALCVFSSSCSQKLSQEKIRGVDRVALVLFTSSRYPEMGGMRAPTEGWHHLFNGWPDALHQDAMQACVETLKSGSRFKWISAKTVHDDEVYRDTAPIVTTGGLSQLLRLKGLDRMGPVTPGGFRGLAKSLRADMLMTITAKVNLQNLGSMGNMTLGKSEAIAAVSFSVQAFDDSGSNIWNEQDITAASPSFPTNESGYPEQAAYADAIQEGFRKAALKVKARMEGDAEEDAKPAKKAKKKKKRKSEDEDDG